jgi:hypothetical protein
MTGPEYRPMTEEELGQLILELGTQDDDDLFDELLPEDVEEFEAFLDQFLGEQEDR